MHYLEELVEDYKEKRIIPFVGSGLSAPFKLPTWKELISELKEKYLEEGLHRIIEIDLAEDEYQKAIDNIKNYGKISEQDIQEYIAEKYDISGIDVQGINHNFDDLANMNTPVILTTNYDKLIEKFLSEFSPYNSLLDYTSNIQLLFKNTREKKVFHIHGCVSNSDSIVISSSKYNELYTDDEYDNKMKAFTSNYSFLFLGFSLQDVFTQRLLQQHRKYFKGNHYMLVSEESIQGKDILSFREEYGVKVITYNINDSDHYHEIKKFLNHLCDSHEGEKQIESSIDEKTSPNGKIVGAKITDFNANHEDSLFYKKLKLANIQDQSIYLSKLFYISAEKFIREAKRLGVSIEIIDGILAQVFMSYHDNFVRIYDSDKQNSQELLEVMHSSLEEIDLNRYVEQRIMPNRYESKGMIHLLADDEQKDIWWGSERFE